MPVLESMDRRQFLKTSATAGAGLVIAFYLPDTGLLAAAKPPAAAYSPNAFLKIATDNTITVIVNKSEMGQGVYTSLPMLLAEELEAPWDKIRVESAPVAPVYNHTAFGIQLTGGSSSVWSSWEQLQKAGAAARIMLTQAAAERWKVTPESCRAERGTIVHGTSKLSYGELAEQASKLEAPKEVKLKDPKTYELVGKPIHRTDTRDKVTGKGVFGIDVKVPGMLVAVVQRPPMFGGKVKSFTADKAKAVPGVKHVVQIDRGVAVVADGFWAANKGREALDIQWDEGPGAQFDSAKQQQQYAELAEKPGMPARNDGDVHAALTGAARKVEAVYEVPYLAHATMEPMNCVADVRADRCEVWTGTQNQTIDRMAAAQAAGLNPEQVELHTTLLGGGFGRRAVMDSHFVVEAVQVSKAVQAPVKVIWTREDDMTGGYYRPYFYHKLSAGVDASGNPVAWTNTIVVQSFVIGTPFEKMMVKDGVDSIAVEGCADLPYKVPNVLVDLHIPKNEVPTLWWRSVGHSANAFVVESFLDEVAHAAGKDPYEFRKTLLADKPRHLGVLKLAAEKAGWGTPLPKGRGRGIAVHDSFGSWIAQVAEVTVADSGEVKVDRVVCAVDCGRYVNPDTIKAQMEGAINFGLSAVLHSAITIKDGRAEQSNFNDYEVLRMPESPRIEVYIVENSEKPGGIGEPGVPPIAPAVGNAIFAATGKRVRRLPIATEELKKS